MTTNAEADSGAGSDAGIRSHTRGPDSCAGMIGVGWSARREAGSARSRATEGSAVHRSAAGALHPQRWRALSVPLVVGFVSVLDSGVVSVAVPSIQRGLGASAAEVLWVVSGYALTFGLALIPAGRAGDALGRRRMFVVALATFVACSAVAGAAPNPQTLIAARLAQGLAAGVLAPQNSAMIVHLFPDGERGRAFGAFGAVTGLAMALGPVAGGLIMALAGGVGGWRWIFFVNVPIGAVALLLAVRLVPRDGRGRREYVDVAGAALLGGAVLCVLLPLVQAESGGIAGLWWLFLAAPALAAAFVAWERRIVRRRREPLVDLGLLTRTPGYLSGAMIGAAYFFGFSGVWLVFSLFFQLGLGYSPLQSALAVTPFAVGVAASSMLGGRLAGHLGSLLVVVGLALAFVGLAATAVTLLMAPPASAAWAIAAPLLLAGVGGGCVVPTNTAMTLRRVPAQGAGSAGGVMQTGQRLGAAIGAAAVAGAFYLVLGVADVAAAVSVGVGGAALGVGVALVIAAVDWRNGRHRAAGPLEVEPIGGTRSAPAKCERGDASD
jgi:EmrB/QacA subfamily drug resistance transporter